MDEDHMVTDAAETALQRRQPLRDRDIDAAAQPPPPKKSRGERPPRKPSMANQRPLTKGMPPALAQFLMMAPPPAANPSPFPPSQPTATGAAPSARPPAARAAAAAGPAATAGATAGATAEARPDPPPATPAAPPAPAEREAAGTAMPPSGDAMPEQETTNEHSRRHRRVIELPNLPKGFTLGSERRPATETDH